MSDIYCRFCAEPWEHDTLHEFNDYPRRAKLFAQYGCNALMDDGERREPCATPCIDERVAEASAFLQDDSPHPEEWCGVYDILDIMEEGCSMSDADFIDEIRMIAFGASETRHDYSLEEICHEILERSNEHYRLSELENETTP